MAYILGAVHLAVYILIYLGLALLPYYIAYSIIEPSSFGGVVGVFILGSIIVPLTIGVAVLTMGGLFSAFEKVKQNISKERLVKEEGIGQAIATITPLDSPNDNKAHSIRNAIIVALSIAIGIGVVSLLNYEQNNSSRYISSKESTESDQTGTANDVYGEEPLNDEIYNPNASYSSEINDDYSEMTRAVKNVLSILEQSGISGVAKSVRDCYVNSNESMLYCVYLDNAARVLDRSVAQQMGFTRNEYLNDDRTRQRANQYFYMPSNISGLADAHTIKLENELINLFSQEFESQQANSNLGEEPSVAVGTENHDLGDTNSRLQQELSQPFTRPVEEDNEIEVDSATNWNSSEDLNTFGDSNE